MSEIKTCPKCNGNMVIGYLSNAWRWTEGKSLWAFSASRVYAYACKNCSYVELYLEQKEEKDKKQKPTEAKITRKTPLIRTHKGILRDRKLSDSKIARAK